MKETHSASDKPPPSSRMQSGVKLDFSSIEVPLEEENDSPPQMSPSSFPPTSRTGYHGTSYPEELDPGEVAELRSILPTMLILRDGAQGPVSEMLSGGRVEEVDFVRLSKDTYSLFFVARPRSKPFVFAISVFTFQILILILVLADTINTTNPSNSLGIPGGVSIGVRTAQFLAVVVAVVTQDDVITSINAIYNGYPGIFALSPENIHGGGVVLAVGSMRVLSFHRGCFVPGNHLCSHCKKQCGRRPVSRLLGGDFCVNS